MRGCVYDCRHTEVWACAPCASVSLGDDSCLLSLCAHTACMHTYVEKEPLSQSHCWGFWNQLIPGCCSGLKTCRGQGD